MTPRDHQQVDALGGCRFPVGGWEKRFRRSLARIAEQEPERELTPSQRYWLGWLCHRYRGQIKSCLVAACPACAGGRFPDAPRHLGEPKPKAPTRRARREERDAEKLDKHNRGVP